MGAVVLFVLFLFWEIATSLVAFTDDAYVRSDFVAIAPQVTGPIITVAVTDNQDVHRGDLLVRIDPTPFQLEVDAAEAVLREAKAQAQADDDSISGAQDALNAATAALTQAQETQQRALVLAHEGVASGETLDAAIAAYGAAAANVAAGHSAVGRAQTLLAVQQASILQATADLGRAEWRLGQTTIRAPLDGTVNNFTLHVGDMGYLDKPLIGIVAAHSWRIIANYKQGYLGQLHPNGTAWVWLDTHPWRFYRARIRGIARGISRQPEDTGLLPYVTPTTDWIRLQHRFPVTLILVNPPPDLTYYMGADASCVVLP
jgi:membrane fusion protein, multidrug efflux system